MKRLLALSLVTALALSARAISLDCTPCHVTLGGIPFSRMVNGADCCVSEKDGIVRFSVPAKTDLFIDPNGEKLSATSIRMLLTEIDNTRPFTFTVRVQPGFTREGLYNAAALFMFDNVTHWQKFCFEQDERGKHRIVTVRTIGTSDDNNHDVVTQGWVYLKISSDTHTIASYYSIDGREWQMVRLYRNDYAPKTHLGIASQCPTKGTCTSLFSEMKLTTGNVTDFRTGD